jgi:hypothetical protein
MYRRAFALLTGAIGILAAITTVVSLYVGVPAIPWLLLLKLAIAVSASIAAILLWMGHRLQIASAFVAWVLIGVWAAPLLVFYGIRLGA